MRNYDDWAWRNRGGFNNVNSVPPNGLAGLGDVVGDVTDLLTGPLKDKAAKLETALTVITIFSGIAAVTGVVSLLRR